MPPGGAGSWAREHMQMDVHPNQSFRAFLHEKAKNRQTHILWVQSCKWLAWWSEKGAKGYLRSI
jgi:hypothetical protein